MYTFLWLPFTHTLKHVIALTVISRGVRQAEVRFEEISILQTVVKRVGEPIRTLKRRGLSPLHFKFIALKR